jgi:hypothetical protein
VGFYAFTTVEYEMVNQTGLDRAQMAKLVDKADGATSSVPIIILFPVGVVLGLVLLAVATWRSNRLPTWAAPVLAATAILGFLQNSKGLGIVTFVLLLVGLGAIASKLLGMSDEEWDPPRDAVPPSAPAEPPSEPAVA